MLSVRNDVTIWTKQRLNLNFPFEPKLYWNSNRQKFELKILAVIYYSTETWWKLTRWESNKRVTGRWTTDASSQLLKWPSWSFSNTSLSLSPSLSLSCFFAFFLCLLLTLSLSHYLCIYVSIYLSVCRSIYLPIYSSPHRFTHMYTPTHTHKHKPTHTSFGFHCSVWCCNETETPASRMGSGVLHSTHFSNHQSSLTPFKSPAMSVFNPFAFHTAQTF